MSVRVVGGEVLTARGGSLAAAKSHWSTFTRVVAVVVWGRGPKLMKIFVCACVCLKIKKKLHFSLQILHHPAFFIPDKKKQVNVNVF